MREASWYIENKLTPPKAFFDWCFSQINTFKWSNKEKTILASDRKNCYVVEKRLTTRTRLTFFDKFYSFAIVLVTSKRIEIQSYAFWSSVEDGVQTIEYRLSNFEQFANDEHIKVTEQNDRFFYGLMSNYGGMSGAYTGTKFYSNNWKERVENLSELRFLKFSTLSRYDIENCYKHKKEIEFLQGIKANVLADEVMYPTYKYTRHSCHKSVDMRTINEKWLKNNKKFFKNSNRSFLEFELEKRFKERRGKAVPGIEKYLDYRDVKKIPKGIGMIRFQNWMIKNDVNFSYYLDYLALLKDLNMELNSEKLIIPKDLVKAHDDAVNLLNLLRIEVEEKEYDRRLEVISKYETEIDDYAFVVPKKLNDLIIEGRELQHCVGASSYIENHKVGRTTIVFVRDKKAIEKPLYTLELSNGRIVQLEGRENKVEIPESAKIASEKWLKWTKTLSKRKAIA